MRGGRVLGTLLIAVLPMVESVQCTPQTEKDILDQLGSALGLSSIGPSGNYELPMNENNDGRDICKIVSCSELAKGGTWDPTVPICDRAGVVCADRWRKLSAGLAPETNLLSLLGSKPLVPFDSPAVPGDAVVGIYLRARQGLAGVLPETVACLPHLLFLDLSFNPLLTGKVPSPIPDTWRYLGLSSTSLSGTLPTATQSTQLRYVSIQNAPLSGTIPVGLFSPVLAAMYLGGSSAISGTLPAVDFQTFPIVNIESTSITGSIPIWAIRCFAARLPFNALTGNATTGSLLPVIIDYQGNQLTGFPPVLPELAQIVDLSQNKFNGILPPAFLSKAKNLRLLLLQNNQLEGPLPTRWGSEAPALRVFLIANNHIQGTLPNSWSNMTSLVSAYFSGNPLLTGTIPTSWGNLRSLTDLGLWDCGLTGEIPASLGQIHTMKRFWLQNNNFTGTIPATFEGYDPASPPDIFDVRGNQLSGTLPVIYAKRLSLGGNMLTGTIPRALFHPLLEDLMLENNQLTGTIPPELAVSSALSRFWLFGNNLGGDVPWAALRRTAISNLALADNTFQSTIPADIFEIPTLERLDLSNNKFHGPLPVANAESSLQVLLAAGNELSGDFPHFFFWRLNKMTTLSLARNNITGTLRGVEWISSMQRVDLADNKLTEWVTSTVDVSKGVLNVQLTEYPSLISVDLSNNRLKMKLQSLKLPAFFPTLEELHFRNNENITGQLPEDWSLLSRLRYLDVSGTGMKDHSCTTLMECLPAWLKRSEQKLDRSIDHMCYYVVGAKQTMQVEVSDSYFNRTNCLCKPGYYGSRKECRPCLPNGICPGNENETVMLAQPGFYGLPDPRAPLKFEPCLIPNPSQTACKVQEGSMDKPCKEGHEGRLCGKCSEDYTGWGLTCVKCPATWSYALLTVAFVLLLAIYLGMIFRQKPWTEDGTSRVAIFYLQMLALVTSVGIIIPSAFDDASGTAAPLVFFEPPALSCLVVEYQLAKEYSFQEIFAFSCIKPALVVGLMMVVCAVGAIVLKLTGKAGEEVQLQSRELEMRFDVVETAVTKLDKWIMNNVRAIVMLLITIYPGVTNTVISGLDCKKDSTDGEYYLENAPTVRCYDSEYNGKILTPAVILLVFVVIGQPVAFFMLLRGVKTANIAFFERYGVLFSVYRNSKWYWEVSVHIRRFLVVALVNFPPEPAYRAFGVVVVFLISFYIHMRQWPYVNTLENTLEELVFLVLIVTFAAVGYYQVEDISDHIFLAVLVFVLNIIMLTMLVAALFARKVLLSVLLYAKEKGVKVPESLITELSPCYDVASVPRTRTAFIKKKVSSGEDAEMKITVPEPAASRGLEDPLFGEAGQSSDETVVVEKEPSKAST